MPSLACDKSGYRLPCRSWMVFGGCNVSWCKYPHIWPLEATTLLQRHLDGAGVVAADRDTLIDTFRHAVHLYAVVSENRHNKSVKNKAAKKFFWVYYLESLRKSMPGKDDAEMNGLAGLMYLAVHENFAKRSVNDTGAAEIETLSHILNGNAPLSARLMKRLKKKMNSRVNLLLAMQDERSLLSRDNALMWEERVLPLLRIEQKVNFHASLRCLACLPASSASSTSLAYLPASSASSTSRQLPELPHDPAYANGPASSASSTSRQLPELPHDPAYADGTILESCLKLADPYYENLCDTYDALRSDVIDPYLLRDLLRAIDEDEQIAQES